ncbi:MAG: gluconokinase [Aggregatilineales bacterium]
MSTLYHREPVPAVLAIDIGTSSTRVLAYTADGQPAPGLGAQRRYEPTVTPDGGSELDANQLLAHVFDCLDEALAAPGSQHVIFTAVGIDTFVTNLLGLDSDGKPITPILMWNDTRSRAYVGRLGLDPQAIHEATGSVPHVSFWPPRLLWLADTQPDLFRRVARWLTFGEWLHLQLFGRACASTSMAAWTGMIDRRSGDWHAESIRAAGIKRAQLSEISDKPFGALPEQFARRWPRLRSAVWYPALGDGYTANVGCGAVKPDRTALTLGTSGAVRTLVQGVPEDVPLALFCYKANARESLVGGSISNAGNVFAWLQNTLGVKSDPFSQDVEPDAHGLTVLPFWAGERSPGWHDGAQATILGMTLNTTVEDIARASLEAAIYQLAAIDDKLCAALGHAPAIYGAGGVLANSPGWAQVTADVLGRDVTLCADPQSSARGTALLALNTYIEPTISAIYHARPDRTARYRAARQRQQQLYDLLLDRQD